MNILCDFHHSDLWWSHHLIFQESLGHTIYRPRGMEWMESGYYQRRAPDVAAQFLVNSMFTLEDIVKYPSTRIRPAPGSQGRIRASMDHLNGSLHYPLINTISFEEFADTKIDIIMPTLSENQEPWLRLRNEYKPKATLIREEGNVNGWSAIHPEYRNVLTSDLPTFQKIQVPSKMLYHQRFDTKNIFTYKEPSVFNRITCFMPGFRGVPDLVNFMSRHDFVSGGVEFLDYGHHSKLGFLASKEAFAEAMGNTSFVWHVKPGGDGFGHVLHSSMAMGRPVITIADDYRNSIAWPLLEDGKTCILIGRDPIQNLKKIRSMMAPETIKEISLNAAERFKDVVDYNHEADMIQNFLERLV